MGKAGFCSTDCKQKTYKAESSICPTQTTGSAFLDFLIQMGEESEREAAAERAKQKVTMSSKYRLEDRYVSYIVKEPKLDSNLHLRFQSEAPEAVIELDVTEDSFGLDWPHATMM